MDGFLACKCFPAPDDDVDIEWVEFSQSRPAAGLFGSNQSRAGATEAIEDDVATVADIANSIGNQRDGLGRGMGIQFRRSSVPEGVATRGFPDVGAIPAAVAQSEVVDVGLGADFESEYQLVLATVESSHAPVGLCPNTELLQF